MRQDRVIRSKDKSQRLREYTNRQDQVIRPQIKTKRQLEEIIPIDMAKIQNQEGRLKDNTKRHNYEAIPKHKTNG